MTDQVSSCRSGEDDIPWSPNNCPQGASLSFFASLSLIPCAQAAGFSALNAIRFRLFAEWCRWIHGIVELTVFQFPFAYLSRISATCCWHFESFSFWIRDRVPWKPRSICRSGTNIDSPLRRYFVEKRCCNCCRVRRFRYGFYFMLLTLLCGCVCAFLEFVRYPLYFASFHFISDDCRSVLR